MVFFTFDNIVDHSFGHMLTSTSPILLIFEVDRTFKNLIEISLKLGQK